MVASVLSPGEKAPSIALADQIGKKVKLTDFKGRKVLVYFYPKADTPGCTTQACGLRDILGDIGDTAVLGISPDPPSRQAKFDQKYGLGFPLLADEDHPWPRRTGCGRRSPMYGRKYMGIVRSAFLVDEKGKLADAWYKISPKDTPKNLLAALAGPAASRCGPRRRGSGTDGGHHQRAIVAAEAETSWTAPAPASTIAGSPVTTSIRISGSCSVRPTVGGIRPRSMVSARATAPMEPAAAQRVSRDPFDRGDGGPGMPNTLMMASDSGRSLAGVEVPWALMWVTTPP